MTPLGPTIRLRLAVVLFSGAAATGGQETGRRAVTDGLESSRAPAWSPDGQRLAFETFTAGHWRIDVLDLRTGVVERLTPASRDERYPAWSPDGRQLISVCADPTPDLCIRGLGANAEATVIPMPGDELWPAWSPDGSEIAVTRRLGDRLELGVLRAEAAGWVATGVTAPDGRWPRWSADGRWLAFFSRRETGGQDDEIYLLDRRSGSPVRITNRAGHDFCPSWNPGGTRLVVASTDQDGTRSLRIIDRAGQELGRMARGYFRVTEPAWSPDGRYVAYAAVAREGEEYRVFVEEVPAGLR